MHAMGFVIVDEPTKEAVAAAMADFEEKHWDWYRCGGRWDGWLTGEEKQRATHNGFNFEDKNDAAATNSVRVRDLPPDKRDPYFIVTPRGYWIPREYYNEFEKSPHGDYYGAILPTPDFEARLKAALEANPDKYVVVVDAHN